MVDNGAGVFHPNVANLEVSILFSALSQQRVPPMCGHLRSSSHFAIRPSRNRLRPSPDVALCNERRARILYRCLVVIHLQL